MTCAECGYDLRGLPAASACPECGRSIAETAAAAPVTAWLPGFRRGVACLAAAWLLMPFAERAATSRLYWGGVMLNPDGLLYLARALLPLPAALWMTLPAPFLPRDPRRDRRRLLALLAAQAASAVVAILALPFYARGARAALLASYALAPLAHAAAVAVLFALLARPLPLVPRALPRWLVRGALCLAVAALLGPALVTALVNFARLDQVDRTFAPGGTWLPPGLTSLLHAYVVTPAHRAHWPVWAASLLVVLHTLVRLHEPVGLARRGVRGGPRGAA